MPPNIGNFTVPVNGFLTGTVRHGVRSVYRPMLRGVVERIEQRLRAVGLSAAAASKKAGLSEDAIRNMRRAAEAGDRKGVSTRTVAALAPVLQTTIGWLLEGEGEETAREGANLTHVKLVGYVGAGSTAHFYAGADDPNEEVEAPEDASESTVAAEIRGTSLGPALDRWLVFYDEVRSPVTPDLHGQLCVVGLPNDQVLVKVLRPGAERDRYHLISNGSEEPIFDQAVLWAARVKAMRPRS